LAGIFFSLLMNGLLFIELSRQRQMTTNER